MRASKLELYMLGCLAFVACDDDDNDAGASAAVVEKLRQCELVTEGKVSPYVVDSEVAECSAKCQAEATCDELTALYCEARPSARLRDCQAECLRVDCADGQGRYSVLQRCNGRNDCTDQSDESGCAEPIAQAEYCKESGARIIDVLRCNGIDECGDGTDELGCPAEPDPFTCTAQAGGFLQQVPKAKVCDLFRDCVDGSDESEEQGCAQRSCPLPSSSRQ